jgi:hypothetical protein
MTGRLPTPHAKLLRYLCLSAFIWFRPPAEPYGHSLYERPCRSAPLWFHISLRFNSSSACDHRLVAKSLSKHDQRLAGRLNVQPSASRVSDREATTSQTTRRGDPTQFSFSQIPRLLKSLPAPTSYPHGNDQFQFPQTQGRLPLS